MPAFLMVVCLFFFLASFNRCAPQRVHCSSGYCWCWFFFSIQHMICTHNERIEAEGESEWTNTKNWCSLKMKCNGKKIQEKSAIAKCFSLCFFCVFSPLFVLLLVLCVRSFVHFFFWFFLCMLSFHEWLIIQTDIQGTYISRWNA